MSKIHQISEKPRPHENVVITIQDDDNIIFDAVRTSIIDNVIQINTSLECFGDHISWDKYVERNTSPEDNFKPISWQYLSEIINPWTSIEDELPINDQEQIYIFYIAINEDAVAHRYDMLVSDSYEATSWIGKFNRTNLNKEKIVKWTVLTQPHSPMSNLDQRKKEGKQS